MIAGFVTDMHSTEGLLVCSCFNCYAFLYCRLYRAKSAKWPSTRCKFSKSYATAVSDDLLYCSGLCLLTVFGSAVSQRSASWERLPWPASEALCRV